MGDGLVLVHVELLTGRVDCDNARLVEHIDQLVVHGAHAAHKLAERTLGIALGGVVE